MTQAEPRPVHATDTLDYRPPDTLRDEIHQLSAGNVVRIPPTGPEFALPPRALPTRPRSFVPQLRRGDRLKVFLMTVGWLASFVWFWTWWLQPEHRIDWVGFAVNSALLMYLCLFAAYFLLTAIRARRFNPAVAVPRLRTAFVVTRAPSEPWPVARATLTAMLGQSFPHPYDVWLCDEDPSDEILLWCRENGVRVSCRRGVTEYHRQTWPRRTRCKEGNLAYFYDHWGYTEYDVVAQLDCDHVPHRNYLSEVVRPFADPAIGYVAAPSVCDTNADSSWAARGRLYREAMFHGAYQLGHSEGLAPLCIGSHYAVRTAALRDIGGLGPELAEDFSTTFLLNSAGWHGAFAIDAEAHGEGPLTFAAMATQEFQWSRSLAALLLGGVQSHFGRMPRRMRLRFWFILLYYPLIAGTGLVGAAMPLIAAVANVSWVNVDYFEFLWHFWLMSFWGLLVTALMRRRGLLRPYDAPLISWEGSLFILARWPIAAWGIAAAVMQRMRPRRPVTFKVTPKTRKALDPLPLRLVAPYLLITSVLSSAAVIGELTGPAVGYVFLCILGSASYAVVSLSVSVLHVVETARASGIRFHRALATARLPLFAGAVTLLPLALAITLYPLYVTGVMGW